MVVADAPKRIEGDLTTAVGANLAAVIEDTNAVLTVATNNCFKVDAEEAVCGWDGGERNCGRHGCLHTLRSEAPDSRTPLCASTKSGLHPERTGAVSRSKL